MPDLHLLVQMMCRFNAHFSLASITLRDNHNNFALPEGVGVTTQKVPSASSKMSSSSTLTDEYSSLIINNDRIFCHR